MRGRPLRFQQLHSDELEKRLRVEADLRRANELVETMREFVRSKDLMQELMEFTLRKHLGEDKAAKIIALINS
jgi:hypothetical protein